MHIISDLSMHCLATQHLVEMQNVSMTPHWCHCPCPVVVPLSASERVSDVHTGLQAVIVPNKYTSVGNRTIHRLHIQHDGLYWRDVRTANAVAAVVGRVIDVELNKTCLIEGYESDNPPILWKKIKCLKWQSVNAMTHLLMSLPLLAVQT